MIFREKLVDLAQTELVCCKIITDDFYKSFKFTTTGNNLCHPITLGLLSKVAWMIRNVDSISIDERMHGNNNNKFQPDLVARDKGENILLIIDFESPNSSDARIPTKDIQAYLDWIPDGCSTEYLVITSLPNEESPNWQLRYTNNTNKRHKGKLHKIRSNPFLYWYSKYKKELPQDMEQFKISFANFNGKNLSMADLTKPFIDRA